MPIETAMDIHPQFLQFGGSLIAIAVLAGLAWWLRLGGKPTLRGDMAVFDAANEVQDGFEAQRISISRGGDAALAANSAGQIMVIKRHGNQFAGRVLTSAANAREEVDGLVVDCRETSFGSVRLSLSDAAYWADAINRL